MLLLTTDNIRTLIHKEGFIHIIDLIVDRLKQDFSQWDTFTKSARYAHYIAEGVIELMPIGNDEYFAYKYVNGHPENYKHNKMSILALGQLSLCHTGEPILLSEMTILTALRTAATSLLATHYGARQNSTVFGIIGTGAQSEFQTRTIVEKYPITEIRYFDIDKNAMRKYHNNIRSFTNIPCVPCLDTHSVAKGTDIVTTCTEQKGHHELLSLVDLKKGVHINAIGGDCPGKTEMSIDILKHSNIVVEYITQTINEGEVQKVGEKYICAELQELITGKKNFRNNNNDITLFDSVGFALEDYSVLHVMYQLAHKRSIGTHIRLIPEDIENIKDLYGYATQ